MLCWIPSSRGDFFLPNKIQTASDYRSSFEEIMRPERALTTHLYLVPMIRMSGAISLLPPYGSWHAHRQLLIFVNYVLNNFACCFVWVWNLVADIEGGKEAEGVWEQVLRRIFGPRKDEVTGELRRLHNEELNDLYSSPNIVRVIKSRRMRWVGNVARMGEERGVYKVLVGKPEGKRPLGRPRRRWMDIRMDLQEVGCGYMDGIELVQDRERWRTLVSAVMNLRVPWNAGNFLTSHKPVSFSRRTLHNGVSNILNISLFSCFDLSTVHCRCRGLLLHLVTINDTHTRSVGLLWTNDPPVAETSTWQHTALTKDRHPRPPLDSNLNPIKRAVAVAIGCKIYAR